MQLKMNNGGSYFGSGAYQNNSFDTTQEELLGPIPFHGGGGVSFLSNGQAERYDLDNASSIAPSDVEISTHYRSYRDRSNASRATTSTPHNNVPSSSTGNNSSRASSSHRKRSKNSGGSQVLTVRDIQRSSRLNRGAGSSSSDSSNTEIASRPQSRRNTTTTPRILSRSPHAPPLHDSDSDVESSLAPSDIDLDRIRKPRRPIVHSTPRSAKAGSETTETESERNQAIVSNQRAIASQKLSGRSHVLSQSEDEYSDAQTIPDLSNFVSRGGELKSLLMGTLISSSQETITPQNLGNHSVPSAANNNNNSNASSASKAINPDLEAYV